MLNRLWQPRSVPLHQKPFATHSYERQGWRSELDGSCEAPERGVDGIGTTLLSPTPLVSSACAERRRSCRLGPGQLR